MDGWMEYNDGLVSVGGMTGENQGSRHSEWGSCLTMYSWFGQSPSGSYIHTRELGKGENMGERDVRTASKGRGTDMV